jgi:citrate lyase beta subunit
MFQELIDDYRRQAEQYIADAIKLESGAADQSSIAAASKRGLAAMLFGLADAYEELDR